MLQTKSWDIKHSKRIKRYKIAHKLQKLLGEIEIYYEMYYEKGLCFLEANVRIIVHCIAKIMIPLHGIFSNKNWLDLALHEVFFWLHVALFSPIFETSSSFTAQNYPINKLDWSTGFKNC